MTKVRVEYSPFTPRAFVADMEIIDTMRVRQPFLDVRVSVAVDGRGALYLLRAYGQTQENGATHFISRLSGNV